MKDDPAPLDVLREAVETTEDPIFFLLMALQRVYEKREPLPRWLHDRVKDVLILHREQVRSQRPSKGERSPKEKASQLTIDLYRHLAVERLLERGVPYLEVFEAASAALKDKGYSGSAESVKRSHFAMKKLADVESDGVGFKVSFKRV